MVPDVTSTESSFSLSRSAESAACALYDDAEDLLE